MISSGGGPWGPPESRNAQLREKVEKWSIFLHATHSHLLPPVDLTFSGHQVVVETRVIHSSLVKLNLVYC